MASPRHRSPCRLTMRSPNTNAKELFFSVKKEIADNRTNFSKYRCMGCMGVSGLILCVLLLSAGSVLVGLVLFAVFIALGGFLTYLRSDDAHAMQKDANGFSRSRQLVEVKMEERIRKAVESYKNCLESLEYAPQVISVSSLDYFLDSVFPNFNDMNAAGVVPRNPLVTYAIAWTVLLDEYQKINHPVSSRIRDLHDEWVRLVAKSAKLSLAVAAETDSVKRRGRRSAMSGAIDAVVGGTGLLDSIDLLKSMKDAKDAINDIKEMMNDAGSTKSDQPVPRTGAHGIVKHRMKISFSLFFLLLSPVAVVLFYFGDTLGGCILLVTCILCLIFLGWFFNRWSTSFNALEDLVDLERYLNNAIKQELERNPISGHDELRLATNQLREHIMEAYYDTLGIHLQTELITYNGVPPNIGEPIPLFWRSAGGITSNHATTQNHQATSSSISGNTQSQQFHHAVPQSTMTTASVQKWNTAPVVVTGTPVHQPTSGSAVTTTRSSNMVYQGSAAIIDPAAEMEC